MTIQYILSVLRDFARVLDYDKILINLFCKGPGKAVRWIFSDIDLRRDEILSGFVHNVIY